MSEKSASPNKCEMLIQGKHNIGLTPCEPLRESISDSSPASKAKGIFHWPMYATTTCDQEVRWVAIGCKSGEHEKRGLQFNYCPFCGEDIDTRSRALIKEDKAS